MRALRALLGATALLFGLAGCAATGASGTVAAVQWFDGYRMGDFLREPVRLDSVWDIRSAMAQPWYGEFAMAGEVGTLASCSEYFHVQNLALHPADPTDEAPFSVLTRMCDASAAILGARRAKRSHLDSLSLDAALPAMLPAEFALDVSVSEREQLRQRSPEANWADVEEITGAESCGEHCVVYLSEGVRQEVRLLARGDFDGDGLADVMLSCRDSVEDGSYSALRMFLLTRRRVGGDLELLREFGR